MTRQGRDDMMAPRSMTWGPGAVAAQVTHPSTPARTTPSSAEVSVGGAAVEEAAHGNRNLLDHLGRSDVVVGWDKRRGSEQTEPFRHSITGATDADPTCRDSTGTGPGTTGRQGYPGPPPDDAT